MKTISDFFKKYRIQDFYDWQDQCSKNPICPFNPDIHKQLSFDMIPGYRKYELFFERYRSLVEILVEKEKLKGKVKILDIGSGEGFFKFFFDGMTNLDIDWHGIEVWKERAEFCKHIGYQIDDTNLEEGSLPYPDHSFDIVLASHVIEHLPNPKKVIREMGRISKKNGILMIATPTKPPIIANLDSWYHRISKRNIGDTQQAFTHNSIQNLILESLELDESHILDKRGFRIFSSRKKLPLENWKWFYDLSVWLGKHALILVPEVNIIIEK